MLSLQEISHAVYIRENLNKRIQSQRKPFVILEEPEIIKIVLKVLKEYNSTSFVQLNDYQIYVIL